MKKNNKILTGMLALASILSQSPMAFSAQMQQGVVAVAPSVIIPGKERFDQTAMNMTALVTKFGDMAASVSKEMFQFYQTETARLSTDVKLLIGLSVKLQEMAARSPGNLPSMQDYLLVANDFLRIRKSLDAEMISMAGLKGALPEDVKVTLPNAGTTSTDNRKINFEPYLKEIKKALSTIDEEVGSLSIRILDPNGNLQTATGVKYNFSKVLLDGKKVEEMQAKIMDLLNPSSAKNAPSRKSQDDLTLYFQGLAARYIQTYGDPKQYQILTDAEKANAKVALDQLRDLAWSRTHLRYIYGLPIGAVNAKIRTGKFRIGELTIPAKDMLDLTGKFPIRYAGDLIAARDSFTNIEGIVSARALRPGFSFMSLLDPVSLVRKGVNVVRGAVTGTFNLYDAMTEVVLLMGADVEQELILQQSGGMAATQALYTQKYMATPEDKANLKARICRVAPPKGSEAICASLGGTKLADVVTTDTGSARGLFNRANLAGQLFQYNAQLAKGLQETIDTLGNTADNQAGKDSNDRGLDLLK
jgi:hypothetical protein